MGESAVLNINNLLRKMEPPSADPSQCCIYRVTPISRSWTTSFIPKLISIGPLHHRNHRYSDMKRYKVNFFREMLQDCKISVEEWVSSVEEMETRVRACYSEHISLPSNEFIELISVDAGFILQLFWRSSRHKWGDLDEGNLIFTRLAPIIQSDLLLLENQLPYFFLKKLYEIAFSKQGEVITFQMLAWSYFGNFDIRRRSDRHYDDDDKDIRHFTDLIRRFYLLPQERIVWKQVMPDNVEAHISTRHEPINMHAPCTFQLTTFGLKLKAAKHSPWLLDLRFTRKRKYLCCFPFLNKSHWLLHLPISSKVLEIPPLTVDAHTQVLFHNLLAYEQCHSPSQPVLTNYIHLWDCLINDETDVDLLVYKGIIVNHLGDNRQITSLFNELGRAINTPAYVMEEYSDIYEGIDEFYKSRWNILKSSLKHNYFSTPWRSIVSFAAMVVIILTAIQTVCSVIQVV